MIFLAVPSYETSRDNNHLLTKGKEAAMKNHTFYIALMVSLAVLALSVPVVFAMPGANPGQPAALAIGRPQSAPITPPLETRRLTESGVEPVLRFEPAKASTPGDAIQFSSSLGTQGHPVVLEGTVEAVSETGFTLNNSTNGSLSITVSARTVYVPPTWKPQVGDKVRVMALKVDATTYLALTVLLKEPRPQHIEFKGTISALPNSADFTGTWVFSTTAVASGTVEVQVTDHTQIVPRGLTPRVGDSAHVVALKVGDTYIAMTIELERRTEDGVRVKFRGPIRAFTTTLPADWVIGGMTVTVTSETEIVGTPKVGALAEVEALARHDHGQRTLTAIKIVIVPPPPEQIELRARIESVTTGALTLAGVTIHFDSHTRLEGRLQAGNFARVVFIQTDDNSYLAQSIRIERRGGDSNKVMLRGKVTGVTRDAQDVLTSISFSGIEVAVTADTHVDGTLDVGVWAVVQATYTPESTTALTATEIHVEHHTDD